MSPRHLVPILFLSSACGGGEPAPILMPPLHITGTPPAPERARWVFASPEQELRAKLDLGDGRTLYVGEHGRRELGKPGELTHASTLALESLAGVLRNDKRFVFVATDGDVYASTEPLGALERIGKGARSEADALTSVTTGRASLLGISANGTLVRSTDFGATWNGVDYSHTKLVGGAAAVALDTKGNGVLVHLPQRLFVTHDDGASWAPLASPQSGAVDTMRDGADRIFVVGYHQHGSILERDKLVDAKDLPTPIYVAPSSVGSSDKDPPASRTLLTGDHVVQIALRARGTEKPSVDVRSARIGEALPQEWASHPELVPSGPWNQTMTRRIATSGGELVYLRGVDPNDEAAGDEVKPLTTVVLRSKDYGATWDKEDVLQGTFNEDVPTEPKEGVDVAIGPRGWMYVGDLCTSQYSHDCKPPRVRSAGKHAFEDIVGEVFMPLSFVFDEPRNKVYALAARNGRKVVYELPLDGNKLTPTGLLDAPHAAEVAVTVDATGTLRTFERFNGYWAVQRRNAKGEMQERTFVPIKRGTFALVGPHGLSIDEHDGWETHDGGDTWTHVPSNGATNKLMCNEAGCLLDDAQRIGWDLPALASTDVMHAQTVEPTDRAPVKTPRQTTNTPIKLACKTSGPATRLDMVDWMEGSTLGRWAQLDTEHGVNLAWGSKDVSHRVTLMPPLPKQSASDPTQVRTAQEERDNGMVAARYRFAPRTSTGYSPVNVELAWWSAVTGQVHRGVLPHVKAFRVSRFQFSGMARIVDGGLVFRGHDGDGMSFVHDDGKVETIASPDIPFDEVWHSGKRWVVADSGNAIVALAASEDGGKTWTQRSWGFAHVASMGIPEGPLQGGAEPTLQSINGSPKLRMNDWLVDVPSPLPDDPPAPTAIDTSGADMRCDATAVGTLRHAGQMDEASPLSIEISGKGAPEILETFTRVQHDTPSGKMCSSVYGLHEHNANWGDSHEAYLYPEKGGAWSGWYRRPSDTNKEQSVIEPLSCK